MPKKDKNGKSPSGKKMKPADKSCAGGCQYKIYEETVEKKKVKEKDVFDKKKSSPRQKKSPRKKKTRKY